MLADWLRLTPPDRQIDGEPLRSAARPARSARRSMARAGVARFLAPAGFCATAPRPILHPPQARHARAARAAAGARGGRAALAARPAPQSQTQAVRALPARLGARAAASPRRALAPAT